MRSNIDLINRKLFERKIIKIISRLLVNFLGPTYVSSRIKSTNFV